MTNFIRLMSVLILSGCIVGDEGATSDTQATTSGSRDLTGYGDTFFAGGPLDTHNPFFLSLGTNGRTCNSCHVQAQGWGITPAGVTQRFNDTDGLDPIFRTNDGSVSPTADVSTVAARRTAYKMLLSRGLIRVGLPIPANAEFTLDAVDDPYHYASAAELSLFRRPLPSTNLGFLSTVMWDGRENITNPIVLNNSLTKQANDATFGHAQATGTNPTQMSQIVAFETGLFTTQISDDGAGALDAAGATGGPSTLANQQFYIGINDPLGGNPTGAAFNPNVFTLYNAWSNQTGNSVTQRQRLSIYRGQQIFNTRPIAIVGVGGLNDATGLPTINGFCTTCHDTPNAGNHSVIAPLNIGLTDESQRTPDMPLYTLKNTATGAVVKTSDPGRALISGKWADIGKFKGPILRGLSMRRPFFHNGSAATLLDVVNFYNARFGLSLSAQEKYDLVQFLQAL